MSHSIDVLNNEQGCIRNTCIHLVLCLFVLTSLTTLTGCFGGDETSANTNNSPQSFVSMPTPTESDTQSTTQSQGSLDKDATQSTAEETASDSVQEEKQKHFNGVSINADDVDNLITEAATNKIDYEEVKIPTVNKETGQLDVSSNY